MRQHFVVQIDPLETPPPKPVAAVVPLSPSTSGLLPSKPSLARRRGMQIDIDQEQRQKELAVSELFREDVLKNVQEPLVIIKPRGSKAVAAPETTAVTAEETFRRRLSQPPSEEKIERLYARRAGKIPPPRRPSTNQLTDWFLSRLPSIQTSLNRRLLAMVAVFLLVIVSALFATAYVVRADLATTEGEVRSLVSDLQQSQIKSARDRLAVLRQKRERYWWFYQKIRPEFALIQGKNNAAHIDQLFELSDTGLHLVDTALDSYVVLERGYRQFIGQEDGKSTETFSAVSGQLEILFTELSAVQAKLTQLKNPYRLAAIDDLKKEMGERMPRLRKYFLSAQQLSYVLPEILGENGDKRQYLILLQNNAELRPTGGFIGSFGLLTVQNGKFLDFRVEDVYEADGQLNGYVAPPPEITQYLGEAQWFLRDVNWSPDFPTVAKQAGWFLDKEIKTKPDGVIGVNLSVVKKILEVTGPVNLPDYNEVITKDNLYERAQQHAELNFFPGSTQKRDFLSAVANALFEKLFRENTNTLLVMKALLQSADESELLVNLNNSQANEALANLGWDGALRTPECPHPFPAQSCFIDTVMQVEANVGVNKANQFIRRDIKQTVKLANNQAIHERTITLQNTADSNAWPQGSYKNYFRLFVTKGAQLSALTINGAPVDLRSVAIGEEKDKTVFGFLVNVPIKSTTVVQLAYVVAVPDAKPLVYALFEQKQSGAGEDKVETAITIDDKEVLTVAPEPEISGRTLKFSSTHRTHQFFAIEMR